MKKSIFTLFGILLSILIFAQSPEGFKYQAVVRNTSGAIVPNQAIGMQVRLRQGTATGALVYEESFTPTSNTYGLVNMTIGAGTASLGTFANIDWSAGPYFVEIGMDITGGTSYTVMGTSQLMSVPYALYAKASGTGGAVTYTAGTGVSITGNIINNTSPDQTVTILGTGSATVTGTYPNFTINATDDVNDADANPTNEIQTISKTGNTVTLSNGGGSFTDAINDADASPTNELQDISLVGDSLQLTQGSTINLANINNAKSWNKTGNTGTTNGTNFMGTTDNQALDIRTNNIIHTRITTKGQIEVLHTGKSVFIGEGAGANDDLSANKNTFVGFQSGNSNTTGYNNTASGFQSLYSNTTGSYNLANGYMSLYSNTTGAANTVNGYKSMYSNTTGYNNTASGYYSLYANTTGHYNIANGYMSLRYNTSGSYNAANGYLSLYSNNTGIKNTASGSYSLYSNTTGGSNTANGYKSLYSNTTGGYNTASGYFSLFYNTTGYDNTASGSYSLQSNTTGGGNTANGSSSLYSNTTGGGNTADGYQSLTSNTTGYNNTSNGYSSLKSNTTGAGNTANGYQSLFHNTSGNYNTALGYYAGYYGNYYSNRTAIGYNAGNSASNQVRIGNSSVNSIGGYANWSNVSDARFKKDINENVVGLDFILKLRPVTYHLDMDAIAKACNTPGSLRLPEAEQQKGAMLQTGFIAQEVEKTAQTLGYDFSGVDAPKNENDYYGLRYAEFVVPLVKATQEQQTVIENQQEKIENQQKEIDELKKLVEQLLNK